MFLPENLFVRNSTQTIGPKELKFSGFNWGHPKEVIAGELEQNLDE